MTYASSDNGDIPSNVDSSGKSDNVGLNNFCTYIFSDNGDIPSNVNTESTEYGATNTFCERTFSDKLDYPYVPVSHVYPNESPKRIPSHNKCKNKIIKINRNPPNLDKETWEQMNAEFLDSNKESWSQFRAKEIEPEKYIEALNKSLADFLKSKPEFQYEVKEYFAHKKPTTDPIEEMRLKKNSLNKKARSKVATEKDKIDAKESIRLYNYLLK